jgi:predicted dehydrogenase
MARAHLGVLAGDPRVRLVGVHDVVAEKAAALAAQVPVLQVYPTWHALLQDPAVDLVLVLLPHDLHFGYCMEALQHGKHVVCEKPLATSRLEAQQMLAARERAGRYLLPVHNRIYDDPTQRAHALITAGALGEIFLAQSAGLEGPETVAVRPWLATHQGGGGVLLAQAVHAAYLLRYLVGEVHQVACFCSGRRHVEMMNEDTAVVSLRFQNGALGQMTATFAVAVGPHDHMLTLFGTAGWLALHHAPPGQPGLILRAMAPRAYGDADVHDERFPARRDFQQMWDDYLSAMLTGTQARVTAADGAKAVEIVLAAYRAEAEGRAVVVGD